MLVPLRFQPPSAPSPEDPFALFMECHQRIRNFLALGQRLATAPGVTPQEVKDAAARLERYFTVAMPKHVADEELSLAPRLRELPLSKEVLARLEDMEQQHRDMDGVLERLVPRWQQLQRAPEQLVALAPALAEDNERLATTMEAHLLMEERVLFPFAESSLSADGVAGLMSEVRARRGMAP